MGNISKQEFANLILENRQRFYRIAFSYVKDEQSALDIVSEAMYKGLRNIKSLKDPALFKTWMTRIVINTAIDELKKNRKLVSYEDYVIDNNYVNMQMKEFETNIDLYAAIDSLNLEDKTYIILKYFEEYSFRDISEMLGIAESTVKTRMYKCLRIMKEQIEGGVR